MRGGILIHRLCARGTASMFPAARNHYLIFGRHVHGLLFLMLGEAGDPGGFRAYQHGVVALQRFGG